MKKRHRTKRLLLEFEGDIKHDKLLKNLRTIFKPEITGYLIVTDTFIKGNTITYALLEFEQRIDIYDQNINFTDNNILFEGVSSTVFDIIITYRYLLKTTEEKREIFSNILNYKQYISVIDAKHENVEIPSLKTKGPGESKPLTQKQQNSIDKSIEQFHKVLESKESIDFTLLKKIVNRLLNYYYKKNLDIG